MILKFSTATNLKILEAESKDFQEILALQRLAFYENAVLYNDFNITPLTQTIEDIANESKTHTILKAVSENKIIGTVRGGIIGDYCHLSKLSVHPNFQNQGIGQRLILAIESNFKGATFRIVTGYKDEKNIALYQKLGYKIYKNERIENNPCSVFMEKVGNNSEF
ncbi:MAG: GNAT family N-acetyltransferase [Firmicutes bacterium]|nr:GNAT family N-acetyltransferase [Bacillota bacterium]